jgi:isoquinoline 1-oxidoreductase subunit alpha
LYNIFTPLFIFVQGKDAMSTFTLQVNGQTYPIEADGQMPLLWVLRDLLNLTGTKFSCGEGLCGACTVLVNGNAVRSCITPLSAVVGKTIVTIEGLSANGTHPLQRAWQEERVSQCGYCQPGQIMNAAALLASNPDPTDADIDAAMSNNLCRCGTYNRIRKAIHRAAQEV